MFVSFRSATYMEGRKRSSLHTGRERALCERRQASASRDLEPSKGGNTYWYVSLGVTSQGVLSQSSATWTSTISCSSSELEELFEPLPQKETHLRAGGRGELRGEAPLRMRQPFIAGTRVWTEARRRREERKRPRLEGR